MNNIIIQISKIKVDSIYGKKKHFNAASRYLKYHKRTTVGILISNAIITSALIYSICKSVGISEFILLGLILVTSILTSINEWAKFNKSAAGHNTIGNKYLSLSKKANNLVACIKEEVEIDKFYELSILQEISDEINILAEAFPTNKKDYAKAQEGIKNGEENYTEEELDLL